MDVWGVPKLRVRAMEGGSEFSPGSHFRVVTLDTELFNHIR